MQLPGCGIPVKTTFPDLKINAATTLHFFCSIRSPRSIRTGNRMIREWNRRGQYSMFQPFLAIAKYWACPIFFLDLIGNNLNTTLQFAIFI